MATHVLGMAEAQASSASFAHDFRAASKRTGGKMIDAMTATQVSERRVDDSRGDHRPARRGRPQGREGPPAHTGTHALGGTHEAGPALRRRKVAFRLPRRHDLHPRHVDAPARHQPSYWSAHGAHGRPRRAPDRRRRRRVGPAATTSRSPSPSPGQPAASGGSAMAPNTSSSAPSTSAGSSAPANTAPGSRHRGAVLMGITTVTQFHAAPGQEDVLAELLAEGRNRMRAAEGCESFDLLRDETTPAASRSSNAGSPTKPTTQLSPSASSRPVTSTRCCRPRRPHRAAHVSGRVLTSLRATGHACYAAARTARPTNGRCSRRDPAARALARRSRALVGCQNSITAADRRVRRSVPLLAL